jgi:glycosyltransferase involved in cell wall biosynthesis
MISKYYLLSTRTMRIGIDCRTIENLHNLAGVGQYTLFLIQELLQQDSENEYVLFFDKDISKQEAKTSIGEFANAKIVQLPARTIPFVSAHISTARTMMFERLDLLHSPGGHLPYFYKGASVITIHDLSILRHPEWFPESAFERFFSTRILLRRAMQHAKHIIAPSTYTASELKHHYGVADDRIRVIPMASALSEESNAVEGVGENFLLFVGTIEPRKNLVQLLQAFSKLEDKNVQLVLAGGRGWKNHAIMTEIKKTPRVQYLGYVSQSQKCWLMEHAAAFVFPSLDEGFGMPVLEAMSVGTPVVTSNAGALPEVARDAALLVDPKDTHGLTQAMEQVLSDKNLSEKLAQAGKQRAQEFSWERTARETLRVYKEIRG